jgi:hypothetical protein
MRFVNVRRAAGLEPLPPVEPTELTGPNECREPPAGDLVASTRVETTTLRGEPA